MHCTKDSFSLEIREGEETSRFPGECAVGCWDVLMFECVDVQLLKGQIHLCCPVFALAMAQKTRCLQVRVRAVDVQEVARCRPRLTWRGEVREVAIQHIRPSLARCGPYSLRPGE